MTVTNKKAGSRVDSLTGFLKNVLIATAITMIASSILYFLASSVWQWFPHVDLLLVGTLPLVLVGVGGMLVYYSRKSDVAATTWWILFCGIVPAGLIYNYFKQWPAVGFIVVFLALTIFAVTRIARSAPKTTQVSGSAHGSAQGSQQATSTQGAMNPNVVGAAGQMAVSQPVPPGFQPEMTDFGAMKRREVEAQEILALARGREADATTLQTLLAALPHLKEAAADKGSRISQEHVDQVLFRIAQLQAPLPEPALTREQKAFKRLRGGLGPNRS